MVEKTMNVKKTPERSNSNGFRKAKLLASVAIIGTLAACGSREEKSTPGIPSEGGAAGAAGSVEAGATSTGATSSGGSQQTGGSSGSTSISGNGGQAGSRECPITAEYDLSCDSLTSVPKTVQVGEQVSLGLENGAMVIRLAEVSGQDFDTAHWEGSNETCDSYSVSVREGENTNLWVANNVVNVRVNEVSPDPQTQDTLVNVVFSAVCEEQPGTGGASGQAGSAGQAGSTQTGGASGQAGSSGTGGAVVTACEVQQGNAYELVQVNTPLVVGGYTLTYVGSDSETATVEVSCGGSRIGTISIPVMGQATYEDNANNMSISINVHSASDTAARLTVAVTQN